MMKDQTINNPKVMDKVDLQMEVEEMTQMIQAEVEGVVEMIAHDAHTGGGIGEINDEQEEDDKMEVALLAVVHQAHQRVPQIHLVLRQGQDQEVDPEEEE